VWQALWLTWHLSVFNNHRPDQFLPPSKNPHEARIHVLHRLVVSRHAYELVFGRRPFRGRSNNDLNYSIQKDPVEWPEDANYTCTRAGRRIIGESADSGAEVPWFLISSYPSFSKETQQSVTDAKPTVKVSKNCNDTHGSRLLNGTLDNKAQTPPFVPEVRFCRPSCIILVDLSMIGQNTNFVWAWRTPFWMEDNHWKRSYGKLNMTASALKWDGRPRSCLLVANIAQLIQIARFTTYDFKLMQRRSFYPTNQQLISTATWWLDSSMMPTSNSDQVPTT
jgi:serine/threonine kinase 32